ncbi:hypothetical protein BofuT4_uP110830.1 [Botrytis cinerea T4]|uniref:Uncharacterized protein n=1 Tax=Botryotinia fuckeliana (strain T4) TaxID=999810 RepID=G2Y618_BOTF4|nr:hypothetical protein BofuT4_uP110830.1 [Botrytis cinerea T4]
MFRFTNFTVMIFVGCLWPVLIPPSVDMRDERGAVHRGGVS